MDRNIKTDIRVGSRQSVHVSLDDTEHKRHVKGDYLIIGLSDNEYSNACFITLTRGEAYRLIDVLKNTLTGFEIYQSST